MSVQRWESAYGLCKSAKVRVGVAREGTGGILKRGTGESGVQRTEGRLQMKA
jgi:hypothetical protein